MLVKGKAKKRMEQGKRGARRLSAPAEFAFEDARGAKSGRMRCPPARRPCKPRFRFPVFKFYQRKFRPVFVLLICLEQVDSFDLLRF